MSKVGRVGCISPVFTLKPGVEIEGKICTSAVVRLLTRGDEIEIHKQPEDTRENFRLLRSIVQIGEYTDLNVIGMALNFVTTTDEVRIRLAIAKLESESLSDPSGETEEISVVRTLPFDICSELFTLNPGINVDEKWHSTCVVRLLRRGEINEIERELDEIKRDDLTLLYSVVQIGEIKAVEQRHIDLLLGGDVQRIEAKLKELRAQHAPTHKSCEECGAPLPD